MTAIRGCVDDADELDDEHSEVNAGRHTVRSAHVLHDAVWQLGQTRLSGLRTGAGASTPGLVAVCGLQPRCCRASLSAASPRVLCGAPDIIVAWIGSVLSDAECDGWSNDRRYTSPDECSNATRCERRTDDIGASGSAAQFLRRRDRSQSQLGRSGTASQSATVSVDAVDRCQRRRPLLVVFFVAFAVQARPDLYMLCMLCMLCPFLTPFVRPLFAPLHDLLSLIFPRRCGPLASGRESARHECSVSFVCLVCCVALFVAACVFRLLSLASAMTRHICAHGVFLFLSFALAPLQRTGRQIDDQIYAP